MIRANNLLRAGIAALPVPVANNAAKLALTGILPGYTVRIAGESNRLEMYLGNIAGERTAIIVSGAGAGNGVYIYGGEYGGSPYYLLNGEGEVGANCIFCPPHGPIDETWYILDPDGEQLYFKPGTLFGPGEWAAQEAPEPLPVLTQNPVATASNWRVLGPV